MAFSKTLVGRWKFAAERALAPGLARTLNEVAEYLRTGERDFAGLERAAATVLEEDGFRVDYVSIRRPDLQPPASSDKHLVILAAAWLGTTRLIDNLPVALVDNLPVSLE